MTHGFKADWHRHQNKFLGLMLKELELLDVDFNHSLKALINQNRPSVFDRMKACLGKGFSDSSRPYALQRFTYYQEVMDKLYSKKGRRSYLTEREKYKKECLANISAGKSISPFVGDLASAAADTRKSNRFMDYFERLSFGTPKERAVKELCEFDPQSNCRPSLEYERIAGIWKRELKKVHKPIDVFHGFNETLGFAALDKLFADAGGLPTTIAAGTRCSHAGVLRRSIELDDHIPCWTTTDPHKSINYAATAITIYNSKPSHGAFPQIISGIVATDLHCGVMHGTSFDQFTKDFCENSHDNLKVWIASWCVERQLDGLVGTNGGTDELVIMRPSSKVNWTPWIALPTTQADFDRKYGKPPSLVFKAPQPASPQQPPPAPSPAP